MDGDRQDDVEWKIDEALGNAVVAAYQQHRRTLRGVAFKLCRDKDKSEELVGDAVSWVLTGGRTVTLDEPMVGQLCQAIGTLWTNERNAHRNKLRDFGKTGDDVRTATPTPEKLLEKEEDDVEFNAMVGRIEEQLGDDDLAKESLQWILDDEGESLRERAVRLGRDPKKFALAHKRALYTATKIVQREKIR